MSDANHSALCLCGQLQVTTKGDPARAIWADNRHHWMIFPDAMPVFPKATPGTT
jgi:hypothetical protein